MSYSGAHMSGPFLFAQDFLVQDERIALKCLSFNHA